LARVALLVLLALLLAGCGGKGKSSSGYTAPPAPELTKGAPPWPAPPNPIALTKKAGLVPEKREFLEYHVHAHLDIFVNGQPVGVPAGIGINIKDPAVKHSPADDGTMGYGGIDLCATPCISPLHTHIDDGILHTETKTVKPNRLGQFFIEWNVPFSKTRVGGYSEPKAAIAFFVNGTRYTGDPRDIELANLTEIAIVIGSPPSPIPAEFPQ
jgi:hypothetical protein